MRAISLLISATLFASAALAQPARPPTTSGTKTVEGVTVTGRVFPKTECRSKDTACINTVVAELKRLYPEELKRFCFQRQMRAMRDTTLFGDADPGGTRPTQTGVTFTPAAPLSVACSNDPK